jgi:hypothetical protein
MNATDIDATRTETERRVRVTFEDGTERLFVFGTIQDDKGRPVLPDAGMVAREVKALLNAEVQPTESADDATSVALSALGARVK